MSDFSDVNRRSLAAYSQAIAKGKNEHERVLWDDPARQYYRFQELIAFVLDLARPGLAVLDIGCGNGEFLKFINFQGFRGRYSGIDLHPGMIEEATRRFPGASFQQKDILRDAVDAADIVVMSGVFNVDCGQTVDYVASVLSAAFNVAREQVIFNAISTRVTKRDEGHFYLDPADAVAIAGRLSGRFSLRHGFVPFNYTVSIAKDEGWQSLPW